MDKKRAIITIINSIDPTVMEFNEFVLYRARCFPEEKHYFIALGPAESRFVKESRFDGEKYGVSLIVCGGSYVKLRKILKSTIAELKEQNLPFLVHLSQPRSAVAAMFFNFLLSEGVPTLFTLHSTFDLYVLRTKVLTVIALLFSDLITCVSQSTYDSLPYFLKLLKTKRIRTIINGSDIERVDEVVNKMRYESEYEPPVSDSNIFRILNVSRIIPAKNQLFLVKLLPLLPNNIILTILGDGPLRKKLETEAEKLNVAHKLNLRGIVSREEVFREMLRSDLFVSGSVREGLPIAVLEAMAVRMPVILSEIGPHKDIASKGLSIKILPAKVEKWANLINSMIEMPANELKYIGIENRKIVESHFSLQRMHKEYTEVYDKLLKKTLRQ